MLHRIDKKICFYEKIKGKDSIIYNGEKYDTVNNDLITEIFKKPYNHEYILVPYKGTDIETDYKQYIDDIEKIKLISDGKINMYRTGTYSNTALCIFNSMNRIQAEKIENYEIPYLDNGGGTRYARPYQGKAYKYDICSYYPSVMDSKKLKIPIKKGTLTSMTTEEIYKTRALKYGIYNVTIECDDKIKFTVQKSNMYSHIEVNYAKKLKLKIVSLGEHIIFKQDDLVSCHSVFGEFVKYMFELKKKDKVFKNIISRLWGSLVQKNGGTVKQKMLYSELDTKKFDIIKMTPINKDMCEAFVRYPVLFYRNNFARLNAFLLGFTRVNMHKTFELLGYDNIVFSHTDSIISTKRIEFNRIPFGDDIGKWKYEGVSNNCVVNNMNRYKFN